jgi:hypothetical protein
MAWCGHGSVRQGADNREEFLQLCIHAELLSGVSAQSEKHPSNEQVAQAREILPVRQRLLRGAVRHGRSTQKMIREIVASAGKVVRLPGSAQMMWT